MLPTPPLRTIVASKQPRRRRAGQRAGQRAGCRPRRMWRCCQQLWPDGGERGGGVALGVRCARGPARQQAASVVCRAWSLRGMSQALVAEWGAQVGGLHCVHAGGLHSRATQGIVIDRGNETLAVCVPKRTQGNQPSPSTTAACRLLCHPTVRVQCCHDARATCASAEQWRATHCDARTAAYCHWLTVACTCPARAATERGALPLQCHL